MVNWKFWKKKDWCPLFRGLGSKVICLQLKTPDLVVYHCKDHNNPCAALMIFGFPEDVTLRKGEHYRKMEVS